MKNKRPGGARWAQLRERALATPEGAQAYGEGWLQADNFKDTLRVLDRAREALGVSQSELARRLERKQPTVNRMLRSGSDHTLATVDAFLRGLGLEGKLRIEKAARKGTPGLQISARIRGGRASTAKFSVGPRGVWRETPRSRDRNYPPSGGLPVGRRARRFGRPRECLLWSDRADDRGQLPRARHDVVQRGTLRVVDGAERALPKERGVAQKRAQRRAQVVRQPSEVSGDRLALRRGGLAGHDDESGVAAVWVDDPGERNASICSMNRIGSIGLLT